MNVSRLNKVIISLIAITLLFSSCSRFNRIRKSGDMNMKYNAAVKYYEDKKYYNALQLFEELIVVFRGTDKAEDAYYYYCLCYFYTGDYTSAAYHFNNFAQTFPTSSKAEDALYYNAYCYYLDSAPSSLDQQSSTDAIRQFQLFINKYPNSARVPECNNLIDELRQKLEVKAWDNAMLYYKMEEYKSAIVALGNVITDFPTTKYQEECLFLMFKSAYLYAGNSIESKKEERYKSALEYYSRLVETFPQTTYKKEADRLYASINEKLKDIKSNN
ncbi:MAG TPA: outer membrane protein assembly factor BamD [Bacteroidia bacterium]|nr:MAG: outer membrane assembly lipoprotein YfiO [Bacteroidetes bacterium OLB10]MBE7511097.1 outer membrane protein assembly factor BamD [Bacteroidia bacterium]MBX3105589.1 outer membrane protein assembly factor BamD [Bacteroidota bacterium]MCE7954854.1 outer membrane protein assembly factor BamD [Bacteroidetes bacterium CHB6]OQB60987.1 MAG: tol-pal system protein YbgF [Bacteroidetes bacterium ADurb.Bin141]